MSLTTWELEQRRLPTQHSCRTPHSYPYPRPVSTPNLLFSQQNPDCVHIAILQVFQGKQLHARFVSDNYVNLLLLAIDLRMAT